jgi:hypothetical protein
LRPQSAGRANTTTDKAARGNCQAEILAPSSVGSGVPEYDVARFLDVPAVGAKLEDFAVDKPSATKKRRRKK